MRIQFRSALVVSVVAAVLLASVPANAQGDGGKATDGKPNKEMGWGDLVAVAGATATALAIEAEKAVVENMVNGVHVAEKADVAKKSEEVENILLKINLEKKTAHIFVAEKFDPKHPKQTKVKDSIQLEILRYEHGPASVTMKVKWEDATINTWIFDVFSKKLIVLSDTGNWYVWHGRSLDKETSDAINP